jgi:hypothetical protein
MWATVVALVCGAIGMVAILVAVSTGHKFDHASSQVDPALAELLYDFAALQDSGMTSATAGPNDGVGIALDRVMKGVRRTPEALDLQAQDHIGLGDYAHLYLKANYQDFQRFQEIDLVVPAEAEATLPYLGR